MKFLSILLSVILFMTGITAHADIYDEIEKMIKEETTLVEPENSDKPHEYIHHVSTFYEVVECEEINIYNKTLDIHLDSAEGMTLDVKPMPYNTTDKTLSFTSSNPSVVTAEQNGKLTATGTSGSSEITIKCGKISKTVTVNVIKGVESVSLSRSDMLFYIDQPITAKLDAIIAPADATNKKVKWKSENTAVAAVDENGTVTPIGTGTTNIIAETEDGGFSAKCIVYVQIYNIPARAVFITNAIEAMPVNTDYQLTPYIYPQNTRDKTLNWYSSNPEVVTIDQNGNLHAVGEGMSVITLHGTNGTEDTFTITCVPQDENPFEYNYISQSVEDRIAALSMPLRYTNYSSTLSAALDAQVKASPTIFTSNASAASRSDVEKYLNPANFTTGYAKYQFMDLSKSNGITANSLNNYLVGKGVLEGKGEVFIRAAKLAGISEVYLAVHSVLESGNGKSKLACGIDYNGTTVYNLFGIGAYDSDPINGGAKYAYEQGWTSVDAAIYGGADWISKNYINAGQNTLYKMKWNPEKPATHQYATDVAWAVKQARTIKSLVEAADGAVMFDVPVYSGENKITISWD